MVLRLLVIFLPLLGRASLRWNTGSGVARLTDVSGYTETFQGTY